MVNNAIENSVYDKLPNLTLGFHGCNEEVYHKVIYEHMHLRKSMNAYDWLGNGIYFWENSYERAMEWAINRYGKEAKVVGAVMSLGHCLNLTDYRSAKILKKRMIFCILIAITLVCRCLRTKKAYRKQIYY